MIRKVTTVGDVDPHTIIAGLNRAAAERGVVFDGRPSDTRDAATPAIIAQACGVHSHTLSPDGELTVTHYTLAPTPTPTRGA